MFKGEQRCALDDKGRINFPAKFREEMGAEFTLTRWLDKCLVAFPPKQWDRVVALLAQGGLTKSRKIKRLLYGGAVDVTPDKQGRILIPTELRGHADIQKEVVVVGVGELVEIWDLDAWISQDDELESDEIAEAMEELGI